jgi:hypothetical protein
MGILQRIKKLDRKSWFICHNCLMHTGHDAAKSLFYTEGPGEDFMGRTMYTCPRCASTNTRSFHQLHEEGSEQALLGLERIARKYPRSQFEVKVAEVK